MSVQWYVIHVYSGFEKSVSTDRDGCHTYSAQYCNKELYMFDCIIGWSGTTTG